MVGKVERELREPTANARELRVRGDARESRGEGRDVRPSGVDTVPCQQAANPVSASEL